MDAAVFDDEEEAKIAAMEPGAAGIDEDVVGVVGEVVEEVHIGSLSTPEPAGELGGVKSSSEGSISESESSSNPSGRALPRSLSPLCLEPGEDGDRAMEEWPPPW